MNIKPLKEKINKTIEIPGSKSLSIRALILSSIAEGESKIFNVLDSDDTNDCLNALENLGIKITKNNNDFKIEGCNGKFPIKNNIINVGSSGITCRFLLAILCASLSKNKNDMEIIFDGSEQLKKRPIKPLVDSLKKLGANIKYMENEGFLPLGIKSSKLEGSKIEVSGAISSQYVSAILMAAPMLENQIEINVVDVESSDHPYIQMALKTMEDFGIDTIEEMGDNTYKIKPCSYKSQEFVVETDLNTANYFFAIGAATGSSIEVKNINKNTVQPGILFLQVLEKMGCKVEYKKNSIKITGTNKLKGGFRIDMFHMAEMAVLLAVMATFADAPIEIYNVKHIRNHESDRISAISEELKKAGIETVEKEDGLIINPGKAKFFEANSHGDHRIAMSLAILGIGANGIKISDSKCVSKTCPEFFDLLKSIGVEIA